VGKPATAAARKLIEQARLEIHEYLRGQRAFFRVPVDLTTVPDFQKSVLQAAGHIPFGEARAYAWIAARVGHPRAVRAVGTATRPQPGAAHPAVPPRVAERRRPRRLHLRGGRQGSVGRARAHHSGAGGLHEHAHRVPRGLHPRTAHAAGQPGGLRLGGGRAVGGLPAVQSMPPGRLTAPSSVETRLQRIDWEAIARGLGERGWATTPPLLTAAECAELVALYPEDGRFRSRVDMARFRFGEGEYKYFANPLPPTVTALRRHAYPRLAPIADAWSVALGGKPTHPPDLDGFLAICAERGQTRPTPLLLRYEAGGYNCLHQDLYGAIAFPLQMTCLLSRPGADFNRRRVPAGRAAAPGPVAGRGGAARAGADRDLRDAGAAGARRPRRVPGGAAAWREPGYVGAAVYARGDLPRRGVVWRGEGGGRGMSGTTARFPADFWGGVPNLGCWWLGLRRRGRVPDTPRPPPSPRHQVVKSDSEARVQRWLGLRSDDRSGGQGGDYPEGQIHQQEIDCERRAVVQSEVSRAADRQEEQEQRE